MQQREDNEAESEKKESVEKEEQQNKQIRDMGQVILNENSNKYKVELLTIIGEVEGHKYGADYYNSHGLSPSILQSWSHRLPR